MSPAVGPEKPRPERTSPEVSPQSADAVPTPSQPLLPMGFALVCGGALAALAAQLLVTAPAFLGLYGSMGIELPVLLTHLLRFPTGLPLSLLGVALCALAGGRLAQPRSKRFGPVARHLCMGVILLTLSYACLLSFLHSVVLTEGQTQLKEE
jgi:hypothetical protein